MGAAAVSPGAAEGSPASPGGGAGPPSVLAGPGPLGAPSFRPRSPAPGPELPAPAVGGVATDPGPAAGQASPAPGGSGVGVAGDSGDCSDGVVVSEPGVGVAGGSGVVASESGASVGAVPGCSAHCGYYALAFFAYWFGAARFDANGDGGFDAADVQRMMNNAGLHLRLSFSRPIPRERRLREMNLDRAKRAERELETRRERRESHLKQMRELRAGVQEEREGNDGLCSASVAARATASASVALAMAGEQAVYSMEVAYYKAAEVVVASVDLDVECVEATIQDNLRQYLPWFTILQVCACFGLWLGYVLQTNPYFVLAEDVSVDDSLLVGNLLGVGKYECHIECSRLGDACWGVAFLEGPATQCKLLSGAPLVQPAQTDCREGFWNWQLSEKQPRAYSSLLGAIGGLETAYPGRTALQSFRYCEEGFEASIFWRLLSYQFTHLGLGHVGSNCLMLLFLAVPLEGFHGTGLTALMYTIGVVGGGLAWMTLDPHEKAHGASGGVYALLGMHLADLVLNWRQKKFRYAEFLLLAAMTAFETVCYISSIQEGTSGTAHSVHAGGLVSGLLVGMVLTRNIDKQRWNRGLQAFALLAGAGLVGLSLACWFSSPFPGIGGGLLGGGTGPLCWIGQVCTNADNTGCDYDIGVWQCVACSTRECVEDWYRDEFSFCVKSGDHQTCDGSIADIVHNCQNC